MAGPKYAFLADAPRPVPELLQYPFVSVPEGSSTKQYVSGIFQRYGLDYEPEMEVTTSELVIQAVKHNLGPGHAPLAADPEGCGPGRAVPHRHRRPAHGAKGLPHHPREIPLGPAARAFVDQYLPAPPEREEKAAPKG